MKHFDSNFFLSLLQQNNVQLSSAQVALCGKFFNLLMEWSSAINLTSHDGSEILEKDFLDHFLAFRLIENELPVRGQWLDVGCGAGFAGVLFSILYGSSVSVCLIDSVRKKINFVKQVIRELGLSQCEAHHLVLSPGGSLPVPADAVLTRATWKWSEYSSLMHSLCPSATLVKLSTPDEVSSISSGSSLIYLPYAVLPAGLKRVCIVQKSSF